MATSPSRLHDLLIEVRRKDVPGKVPSGPRQVWLTITDEPCVPGLEYGFDDLAAVARRIVDHVGTHDTEAAAG